ncbi:hypothetical protein PC128_g12708 [Phytophthora cactorum]|nr:hypothetical protein PC128_g12708 [Phytophthora cactorum]
MHDLETWYQAKAAVTLKISETAEDSAAHRFADDTAARYQLVQLYALRTSRTHRCFFSRSQLLQHRALSRLRSLGLLRSSLNRWMIG